MTVATIKFANFLKTKLLMKGVAGDTHNRLRE